MQLTKYIETGPRGTAADLARQLGVTPVMVSQWCSGAKRIPLRRCVAIERVTGGAVRRWDMFPDDWHIVWPELVNVPGAPMAPTDEVTS